MSYRVRAVEAHSAAGALIDLWTRNLGTACQDAKRRLEWFYEESPAGPGVAHLLEHWIDGESPAVVGCMGIGTRQYWCGAAAVKVALLGDLAVDRKHRTLGPALLLERATRVYAQENFRMSLAFPNAKARASVLRLGFRELGQMCRFAVPLRYAEYMRRRRWPRPLATLAGLMLDAATAALAHSRRKTAARIFRLERIGTPDHRFDLLWQKARAAFPLAPAIGVIGVRSAEFLAWRFLRKPGPACQFHGLTSRADGDLAAYAVVEKEGGIAHIRDLFGHSPETVGALLDLLLARLRRDGFTSASLHYLGNSWLVSSLTDRGFKPRQTQTVVIDWGAHPPEELGQLMNVQRWFLTQADEDA